jgi:cytochrome c-type biogenesis protein CcmH
MAIFWVLVVLLMVLCAWIIFWSATRSKHKKDQQSDDLRVAVFRENLEELESELDTGDLDSRQLGNVRAELEMSMLNEVGTVPANQKEDSISQVSLSQKPLLLFITLPVCIGVFLYMYLGNPQIIEMLDLAGSEVYSVDSREYFPSAQMIVLMEEHLNKNPDDVNGLYFLASNYIALSDYKNAADILEKLYQITGDNPQVLISYIDVLARLNDGSFVGRASELIERAVMAAPDNYSALLFAGLAAEESGDYRKANGYYKRLVPVLEGQPQLLNTINMLIANSEIMMQGSDGDNADTISQNDEAGQGTIRLSVSLSDELTAGVEDNDVLFVYAQALQGPPMPLAIFRTGASALPLEITLDDSLAMMPTRKLSNFEAVKVQARISKTGSAEVNSGDLVGVIDNVQVSGVETIPLMIDSKVP